MTLTIEQDLVAEAQPQRAMCLADWEGVPGFDWADLPGAAGLVLPVELAAAHVAIERPGDSPNQGGFGQLVPVPCREVVLHWWGNPVGQAHDGIVAWLRNPASQVSATFVVSPGRATQILPLTSPSWANGNSWANANSITLECDPNDIPGTAATVVELLDQLVAQGAVASDYRLTGHRDWHSTACPGGYYPRLGEIRQAADGITTIQEDDVSFSETITRADGHKGTAGDMLAYIDQRVEDLYNNFGAKVADAILSAQVTRHGLPDSDPRHEVPVAVREIHAWSDANFAAVTSGIATVLAGQQAIMEALKTSSPAAITDELVAQVVDALEGIRIVIDASKEA